MNDHLIQLKNYINEQIQAGFSATEIANHLRAANWAEADIQQAFQMLHADLTPAAPTGPNPAVMPQNAGAPSIPPQATTVRRGRIRRGWMLLKQSLALIRKHPSLFRFTVMASIWSFLAAFVIILILSLFTVSARLSGFANNDSAMNAIGYVIIVCMYIVLFFIANLYAAGLTLGVLDLFQGQQKTYREYMQQARSKGGTLFTYAVIQATIGLALNLIVERFRFVGWIIARILGALWSLGTLFVVPIIVTSDNPRAFKSVKSSMSLFKETWGEGITSKVTINAGMFFIYLGVTFFYFIVGIFLIGGLSAAFGDRGGAIAACVWIGLFFITYLLLGLFANLANTVVNVALYYYATTKQVPPAFDAELLNSVFIARKGRGMAKQASQQVS